VKRAVQRLEMDGLSVERNDDGSLLLISPGSCEACLGDRITLNPEQAESLLWMLQRRLPKSETT